MTHTGSPPGSAVPVLTDVVDWQRGAPTAPAAAPPNDPPQPAFGALSQDDMVARIVSELQRQVDLMLDYRLRETLTPVLTRLADALVREARAELASTLRDVVAKAVSQELARQRLR